MNQALLCGTHDFESVGVYACIRPLSCHPGFHRSIRQPEKPRPLMAPVPTDAVTDVVAAAPPAPPLLRQ
eukprot:365429-Chlamydomonas_euryale.AAC.5